MLVRTEDRSELIRAEDEPLVDRALILQTLDEILDSTPFRSSRQCQDLLSYVVRHTLTHDDESLKERVIGCEVFRRPPGYNTAEDPVVRIRAGEVRKRLAVFYQAAPPHIKVEIAIPSGSYRVSFRLHSALEQKAGPELTAPFAATNPSHNTPPVSALENWTADPAQSAGSPAVPVVLPVTEAHKKKETTRTAWLLQNRHLLLAVFAAVLAILIASLDWYWHASRPFNAYWRPITMNREGAIIYLGANVVYTIKGDKIEPPSFYAGDIVPKVLPGEHLTADDFVLDHSNFIPKGDAAALSSVVRLLTGFGKPIDLRFSNDITVSDLHKSPIILIGAFDNAWTMEMDENLPFAFKHGNSLVENGGAHRTWTSVFDSHGNITEDYALVSRQLHSKSGGVIFTIAGIGMAGTQAAADFVSDPARMNRSLRELPPGWQNRNFQILLHCTVEHQLPTSTDLVAYRVW